MNIPKDLLFSKTHEWVKKNEDGTVYIGLTDFAQSELGELVFVNLPEEGDAVTAEESFADVESVKAVSDVMSPVSGTIIAVNEELLDAPQLINEQPYEAWFIQVSDIKGFEDLMDADAYEAFIAG
jgi:glycine cleavage system H protein